MLRFPALRKTPKRYPQFYMRHLLAILLTLSIGFAKSQSIPNFESNTTEQEKINSLVLVKLSNEFDQIISYTNLPYRKKQWIFILGYKKGKWEFFKWTVKYTYKTGPNGNVIKVKKTIKKKKIGIDNSSIDSLFAFWSQNEFWKLNNDSLNYNEKRTNDTSVELMMVYHGHYDKFEIIGKSNYRLIQSYAADVYQKKYPNLQRQEFILCRDEFFKLIEAK